MASCDKAGREIEIRSYRGDFEDVAELARRIWMHAYQDKAWFPLWDAAFFRWQFGGQSGAPCLVAYDNGIVVGSLLSMPHTLRIGSLLLPVSLSSWLLADPDYRHARVSPRLLEAFHQQHREQGLAFSLGPFIGDPTSIAHRFWARAQKNHPRNFRVLYSFGMWVKVLAPRRVAAGALRGWERLAISSLGPLLRLTPSGPSRDVRLYSGADLEPCLRLLERASARLDWALVWSREQLARQLDPARSRTLVLERNGQVQGMVNYHSLRIQGARSMHAALIDLWADDDLTIAQRIRLLSHVCNDMRERDVELAIAMRSSAMPAAAFGANLFLPTAADAHMIVLYPRSDISLSPPRSWSLVLR
jgi:hypothetical protein